MSLLKCENGRSGESRAHIDCTDGLVWSSTAIIRVTLRVAAVMRAGIARSTTGVRYLGEGLKALAGGQGNMHMRGERVRKEKSYSSLYF